MRFFYFDSVRSSRGQACTLDTYLQTISHPRIAQLAREIGECTDDERRGQLKKQLPVITWQASFKNGRRSNADAVPSGLYMVDFDHVQGVQQLMEKGLKRKDELGIVYIGKSISGTGVRMVAECRPEFGTIAECQAWLSRELGQPCDEACKDWARASYVVPATYEYYMDQSLFEREPKVVYEPQEVQKSRSLEVTDKCTCRVEGASTGAVALELGNSNLELKSGVQTDFKGIPLKEIASEWLRANGGTPQQGERNTKLHKLAFMMRYITDFNPAVIAANIPHYGLSDEEVLTLCTSACNAQKGSDIPASLRRIIATLEVEQGEEGDAQGEMTLEEFDAPAAAEPLPPLPPIFSHYASIAPNDFKGAVVLCLLPLLGTLGSKLRSYYLNDKVQSPSFQVTLEAGQAQGKNFITRMDERIMHQLTEHDRKMEDLKREYKEEDEMIKTGSTKAERDAYKQRVKERIVPIIRGLGANISTTELLRFTDKAQGLHLYAMVPELDSVLKAFQKSYSNTSDLMRCAFDNAEFIQHFASEMSWSGRVRLYFNHLYSGTPDAVSRFYPDTENGTFSRTLFVTFNNQDYKKTPIWGKLSVAEDEDMEVYLRKLYEVSIIENDVQEEHFMDLTFLNEDIANWLEEQRVESWKSRDRVRNIFYRRCGEVAFRAGMLAFFLWDEEYSDEVKAKVCEFSRWVAEKMLYQFLVRVEEEDCTKDNMKPVKLFNMLPNHFTLDELERLLVRLGRKSSATTVLCYWTNSGKILPHARGAKEFDKVGKR